MFPAKPKNFVHIILLAVYGVFLVYVSSLLSSYHIDEGFQLLLSQLRFGQIISATGMDAHPPLYSVLLGAWLKIFGSTLFSARSLSIVFSLVSACLFYKLLRLKLGERSSIFGTIVYVTFPQIVVYGFVARNYALLLLLINTTFYLLFKNWSKNLTNLDIGLLAASQLALLYTHNLGLVLFVLIQVMILLTKSKWTRLMPYLKVAAITALFYAPWGQVLYGQIATKANEAGWLGFYPHEALRDFGFTLAPLYKQGEWVFAVVYAGILYGITTKVWRKNRSPYAKTVAVYTILLMVMMFVLSFVSPLFYYRYLMITLPLLAYLVAHSLPLKKEFGILASVAIVVANLVFLNSVTQSMDGSEFYNVEDHLASSELSSVIIIDSPAYFYQLKHAGYTNLHLFDPQKDSFSWSGVSILEPEDYLRNSDLTRSKIQYIDVAGREFADHFFDRGYEITDNNATKKANIYVLTRFE